MARLTIIIMMGTATINWIAWNDTKASNEARKVLQAIMDFYKLDSSLGKYLQEHCNHLVSEPTGDTGITSNEISKESLLKHPKSIRLTDTFTPSLFPNSAGVYSVTKLVTGSQYIGSAINFRNRWELHYQDMKGINPYPLHKDILSYGISNFLWTPIKECTNHVQEYSNMELEQSLDVKAVLALQILTQYQCRLFEQAIMSVIKPKLNGNHTVVFSFQWDPNAEPLDLRGDRSIVAIEKDTGSSTNFSSIRQAAKILDMDQRSIKGILNYPDYYRTSRNNGKAYSFEDQSLPMCDGSPHYNEHLPFFEGIDHSVIPHGEVWGYDTNFNKVGTYSGQRNAGKQCSISQASVKRGLNRKFVNCLIEGKRTLVIFMSNRESAVLVPVSVIATDIKEGISYRYSSIESMQKSLGMPKGGYMKSFYLNSGKVYKKRWVFATPDKYIGSVPVDLPV
jgi:hypothetical protein